MKIDKALEDSLLKAPESQLDATILEDIKGWHSEPSALDLLFCLDKITYFSLASEFVIGIFQLLLNQAMEYEDITFEDLVLQRTWKSPDFIR